MLAYAAGDYNAFNQLFLRHGQKIYNLFLRSTPDKELARDLTQETWMRIINARQRYTATQRFSHWLYTIAMNLLRDERKRRTRRGIHESLESLPRNQPELSTAHGEHMLERKEKQQVVQSAVRQLPCEQQQVIILAKYQGLPYAEIAGILGITEVAAKQRAYRALQSLKQLLRNEP